MFNLYHSKSSIVDVIEKSPEISLRKRLLQDAIKAGSFDESAFPDLGVADFNYFEETIGQLKASIVERRKSRNVTDIRYWIAREVLLLRGMLALPALTFLDEESEVFNPNLTLSSVTVELTLEKLLSQIRSFRSKAGIH